MNKHPVSAFSLILLVVLISGCASTATALPPTNPPPTSIPSTIPPTAVGGITQVAVDIHQEGGPGAACTDGASYAVRLDMTSNGSTTAKYEVSATTASGQAPNGFFENFASPFVSDGLTFDSVQTQSVSLKLIGPYNSGSNDIVIRVRVNGGDWYDAALSCDTGKGSAGGDTGSTGGITNTSLKIVQEQGSGQVCSTETTYFVSLDITSNGPTTAIYEISATDGSGQVPDGVFDQFAAPFVEDRLVFDGAGTQTVSLRLTGPYSYPDTITLRARVNGGEFQLTQVSCN